MMAAVQRERLTEALVRDLDAAGVVEWVHTLQDREEELEAEVETLREALREVVYAMNFRSRRDRDDALRVARVIAYEKPEETMQRVAEAVNRVRSRAS